VAASSTNDFNNCRINAFIYLVFIGYGLKSPWLFLAGVLFFWPLPKVGNLGRGQKNIYASRQRGRSPLWNPPGRLGWDEATRSIPGNARIGVRLLGASAGGALELWWGFVFFVLSLF
jgi:hypothetical protein